MGYTSRLRRDYNTWNLNLCLWKYVYLLLLKRTSVGVLAGCSWKCSQSRGHRCTSEGTVNTSVTLFKEPENSHVMVLLYVRKQATAASPAKTKNKTSPHKKQSKRLIFNFSKLTTSSGSDSSDTKQQKKNEQLLLLLFTSAHARTCATSGENIELHHKQNNSTKKIIIIN